MSEPNRSGLQRGRRVRADVRQALLKSGSAHLYPGIPPGDWQPAAVMADMVQALRAGARGPARMQMNTGASPTPGTKQSSRRIECWINDTSSSGVGCPLGLRTISDGHVRRTAGNAGTAAARSRCRDRVITVTSTADHSS